MVEMKCKNCECFIPKRGRYGSGICISNKSKKQDKSFVLTNDKCKCFEEKITND